MELRHLHYPDVDERISVLSYGDEVDAFVIRARRYTVLVDTLSTPQLCAEALERFVPAKPRLLVVNTHADWDHVWGNAAVVDRAPIIAHRAALSRRAENLTTLRDKAEDRFQEVRIVEPTITFTDTLTIDAGDLTIELIHTPGHTPDHLIAWVPALRLCLAGDSVEDPLPELWSDSPESLQQMRESLLTIRALSPRHVLPSHGKTIDPGIAERNLAYFDDVATRIAALPDTDVPREDLADLPGLRYEDVVHINRPLSAEAEQFYRDCHAKAVRASVPP